MKEGKDAWSSIKDRFLNYEEKPPKRGWENINSRIRKVRKSYYKELGIGTAIVLLIIVLGHELNIFQNPKEKTTAEGKVSQDGFNFTRFLRHYLDSNYFPNPSSLLSESGKGIFEKEQFPSNSHRYDVLADTKSDLNPKESLRKDYAPKREDEKKIDEYSYFKERSPDEKSGLPGEVLHKRYLKSKSLPQLETFTDVLLFKKSKGVIGIDSTDREVVSKRRNAVENDRKVNTNKYSYQLYFSPRYTYRRVGVNKNDNVYVEEITVRKNLKQRFGYETGFRVSRDISRKLSLNVELSFVNLKEEITYSYTRGTANSFHLSSEGNEKYLFTPIYDYDLATASSDYYYTGIAVGSSYSMLSFNRRRFYVILGTGINLLVEGKTSIATNGTTHSHTNFPSPENPLEQINFKVNGGIGYGHQLFDHLELKVEPVLIYYLGSTFREREPFGIKPYSLGINIGIGF